MIINALRDKYSLSLLLKRMNISKSGYCHQYKIVHSDGSLEWISIDFKEARSAVRQII